MEDLAAIHEGLQPRAGLRRSLHGKKQGQQTVLVGGAGIFAESLPQRKVLSLGIGRQPGGVGCQKGERRIQVFAVFGQIEVHPAHQVPRGVPPLQKVLYPAFRFRQLDAECGVQFLPQGAQDLRGQILPARHGRRRQRQPVRRHSRIRLGAESSHVARAEFSPVGENRRQRGSGFSRAEL